MTDFIEDVDKYLGGSSVTKTTVVITKVSSRVGLLSFLYYFVVMFRNSIFLKKL